MKTRMMKRILIVALSMVFAVLMFGCGEASTETSATTTESAGSSATTGTSSSSSANGEDVKTGILKIGCSEPQTTSGAVYGLPGARGVECAVKIVNDAGGIMIGDTLYTIELISYDDKGDATEAISVLKKLVEVDGVQYVLGYSSSVGAMTAVQEANNHDVTLIMGNARAPQILAYSNGNTWRTATPNCYDTAGYAEFVQSKGVQKIGFFSQMADSTCSIHTNLLVDDFTDLGIETTTIESATVGETDFNTQATKIINSGADASYSVAFLGESAWFLRQLRELGSTMPHFTYAGGSAAQWLEILTNEQLANTYNLRPSCAYDYLGSSEQADLLNDTYNALFGEDAPQTSTFTYDNFWILMSAMKKAGTIDRATVNKTLAELTIDDLDSHIILEYSPVEGKLFDARGQAYGPMAAVHWDTTKQDWVLDQVIPVDNYQFVNEQIDAIVADLGIEEDRQP